MLLNLSLFTLLCLLLLHLLPQGAQSSRARFLPSLPRHHPHRHPHASPPSQPHIHMVTGSDQQKKVHQHAQPEIAMVTVQVQEFGGMRRTTDPASNQGGNSQNLAASGLGNMLNTQVSGPNPGGNSQSLHVAGPNPGGNSETLAGMLDTPVSGPNPGGNSNTLLVGSMLDTPVSGPNPGGNSEGLYVAEPDTGGHGLAGKFSNSKTLAGMLDTAVSGPSPGGNSNTLLGSRLDTPVSGPNPGGNSEGLYVSEPNTGGHGKTSLAGKFDKLPASDGVVPQSLTVRHSDAVLTNMLDASVSGPNPGGNSDTLGDMLDTAVSGPNPSGNSEVLTALSGSQRLAASSGPNPSGNSEILAASSGPNPSGNSDILAASSGPNPGGHSVGLTSSDDAHTTTHDVAGFVPSTAVPIGERDMVILSASSGPNPSGNSEILAASSGPNPGGHSADLTHTTTHDVAGFVPSTAVPIGERDMVILSASSGPNPGGNSASYGSSKLDVSALERFAQSASSPGSNLSRKAEIWHGDGTLFGELPRVPVPPSGPSPIHNSVVVNQGLLAERKLRGEPIGCEQDGEGASGAGGGAFHGQLGAYINTIHGMGAANLNSS